MGRPPGRPPKVAKELVEIAEPGEDFSDVSGDPNSEFALENQDPGKKYCWVQNNREDRLDKQRHVVRWVPVKYAGDSAASDLESGVHAVRPIGAAGIYQEGDEIVQRDLVLYECSRALWEKRHRWLDLKHTANLRKYNARQATRGDLAAAFQE